MALRKPIVLVNGEYQVLQSNDDLNVPLSGAILLTLVNDNAGSIVIGTPVYIAAAGHVDKAKADASGTSKTIGLVEDTSIATAASGSVAVDGILAATTGQWDAVTGDVGGLTAGSNYFLDPSTAGKITKTAPTTTGQYVQCIGHALSTTEMKIEICPRTLL